MNAPRAADGGIASARLSKARQFAEVAALLIDERTGQTAHPDAYVTQAVHAGIAASDVICIDRLGEYSASGAHDEAISLLKKAHSDSAKHLSRLLSLKTKAGYSASSVSASDVAVARRAHLALIETAEAL